MSIQVPDKTGAVFRLALHGLYTLQAMQETKERIVALEATEVELSVSSHLREDHESRLTNGRRHLESQVIGFEVGKEQREDR